MNRKLLFKLLLLTFSLFLALLAGEVLVRVLNPYTLFPVYGPAHHVIFYWSPGRYIAWAYERNLNLEREGLEGEESFVFRTNSDGFHDKEWTSKKKNTFRIMLLGDSFAASSYIKEEHSFPRLLEHKLNQASSPGKSFEILNAGVGGTHLLQQWTVLNLLIEKLNPDLILNQIYIGNDISDYREFSPLEPQNPVRWLDDLLTRNSRLWVQFKTEVAKQRMAFIERRKEKIRLARGPSKADQEFFQNAKKLFKKYNKKEITPHIAEGTRWESLQEFKRFDVNGSLEEFEGTIWILKHIDQLAGSKGVPVLFFSIPSKRQIHKNDYDLGLELTGYDASKIDLERPDKILSQSTQSAGLIYKPFYQSLKNGASSGRLFYETDGHLNKKGSALMADLLFQWLSSEDLIKPHLN